MLLTVTSKLAQARAHAIDLHGSVNLEDLVGLVGLEVKKRFFLVLKFFTYQYLPSLAAVGTRPEYR